MRTVLITGAAIVAFMAALGILAANTQTAVDFNFYWLKTYRQVSLSLIVFFSVLTGLVAGAALIAGFYVKQTMELYHLRKEERDRTVELQSLRNASLHDVSIPRSESELL